MRRSVRDAIVGFSLVGGIVAFATTMLWLRGVRLSATAWNITASFKDATGLAERSPVTYRGILVGSVGKIQVTPDAVQATLEIDKGNLRLPKPVVAKVFTSSLLGGDVHVSLISRGSKPSDLKAPMPGATNCYESNILCNGEVITGESLTSISTLTEELERILQKADKQDIVASLVDSTRQFDITQKNLDELIQQVKSEVLRAKPIITNLSLASTHISNILAALDNPKTLNDIQQTASSTRSITNKIDSLGTDMQEIISDEDLMKALRSVTIGLGEFFNELYPEETKEKNN